eukprot:225833-Pleurochrysis_carterae.AAC.3
MMVLQDGLVVVRDGEVVLGQREEVVVDPGMLVVVDGRGEQAGEHVERRHQVGHRLASDEVVRVEHHVERVDAVVVRVRLAVAVLDLAEVDK